MTTKTHIDNMNLRTAEEALKNARSGGMGNADPKLITWLTGRIHDLKKIGKEGELKKRTTTPEFGKRNR